MLFESDFAFACSSLLNSNAVEHIAQQVEHLTFNERVDGSSPSMLTTLTMFEVAQVAELVDALL